MEDKTTAKTIWRLAKIYSRMDLLYLLRDTRESIGWLLTGTIISSSSAAGVFLLSSRLGGFGGLSQHEILFMLGWSMLSHGLFVMLTASNNAGNPSRIIGRGQLEHALIMPVPLPLHLLCFGLAPFTGGGQLLFGIGVTVYAGAQLQIQTGVLWWLGFGGLLILSMVVFASCLYIVSSLAFWAPYAAEEISGEVHGLFTSLGAYPLAGFGRIAKLALCTVLPVGSIAWLPASVLLGKLPPASAILTCAAAACFGCLAVFIFRKGLKHYAKVSCPRYSGFGRS